MCNCNWLYFVIIVKQIYEQIIDKEYRKMVQDRSPDDLLPDDLLHQMILLHVAYHNIENCLQRLKRIMVFNTEISSKLESYFTEEIPIVSELDMH